MCGALAGGFAPYSHVEEPWHPFVFTTDVVPVLPVCREFKYGFALHPFDSDIQAPQRPSLLCL